MWWIICASRLLRETINSLTQLAKQIFKKNAKRLGRLWKNKADVASSLVIEIALGASFYQSALQKSWTKK